MAWLSPTLAITDRRKLVPGPRPEEQSVTDNRELTIDEIETVSGGKIEIDFLDLATTPRLIFD